MDTGLDVGCGGKSAATNIILPTSFPKSQATSGSLSEHDKEKPNEKLTFRQEVANMLLADQQHSKPGCSTGLYRLSDLEHHAPLWGYVGHSTVLGGATVQGEFVSCHDNSVPVLFPCTPIQLPRDLGSSKETVKACIGKDGSGEAKGCTTTKSGKAATSIILP